MIAELIWIIWTLQKEIEMLEDEIRDNDEMIEYLMKVLKVEK